MHQDTAMHGTGTRQGALRACWAHRAPGLKALLVLVALLLVVMKASGEPPQWLLQSTDSVAVLIAACVVYAVLLAIPFVPSVEIGLIIMVLFGLPGALGAYLATCTGLTIAYCLGRRLGRGLPPPHTKLPRCWRAWVDALSTRLPEGALPMVSLFGLLNMPGNTVVGGGGGIGMAYGAGGLLSWPAYVFTVALATSVLPLAFATGLVGLEQWVNR